MDGYDDMCFISFHRVQFPSGIYKTGANGGGGQGYYNRTEGLERGQITYGTAVHTRSVYRVLDYVPMFNWDQFCAEMIWIVNDTHVHFAFLRRAEIPTRPGVLS